MNAVDREAMSCEDTCPACGEGIDWEAGDHELFMGGQFVECLIAGRGFDVAVLELAALRRD